MVAVAYGSARIAARKAAKTARAGTARKPWYERFMQALIRSRMQQARREIARHIHLLPYSLDERDNRLVKTGSHDMPFGGW